MGSFAEDFRRCVDSPGDGAAWENFLGAQKRLLASIIFRVASRFGVNKLDEIDDAVQEVCLKISSYLDKIPNDDSILESYMKAVIANAAHDYFRGLRAKRRDILADVPLDSDVQYQTEFSNMEKEILLNQLHSLIGTDPRSRRVFQLYYRFGWTSKEISGIGCLGLSAKGVESLIYRLTSELRQKVQAGSLNVPIAEKGTDPQSA